MKNFKVEASLACVAALLLGCSEAQTNKATAERLAALLSQGPDSEALAQADERLEVALGRENATGALAAEFASDPDANGATQSLNALFSLALERNTDIARATQALNRADVVRMNAIYGYLPQISASATYTQVDQEVVQSDNAVFNEGTASYPVTSLRVELTQPIFNLSRIFNIQLQTTARTVAEVEYIAAVQQVTFDTFTAYVEAAQSRAKINSLRARSGLLGRQIASESTLVDLGLGTAALRNSYAAERASLASEEAVEQTRYSDALADLAYLTGSSVTNIANFTVPSSILRSERTTSAAAGIAAAEENNPALLATAISVVEAELTRKEALASDFAPVLDAFASFEDETREGSRFGGGSQTVDTTVGVRLTIPIFNADGQGYQAALEAVDLRSSALEYFAIRRQLGSQISSTYDRMSDLSSAIAQSNSALSLSGRNVTLERNRVASGESAEIAVLNRLLTQNSARETLEFQQFEYLKAWGRYQFLTGSSLSPSGL
ncbi:TolC family protein [Octadecabacter sp. G9-8]|uniref:TolC family protein n=1 Tax=Octadecabacter dasysiphoniae TaxID=2909341 RepID=A0ABS9CZZ3_9RHOB|nr:TolC family protein [Octadecabacter dasysiphoniae]MCF2872362.1 TolC family protein [Octadecabacter dasysiphoniae]